MHIRLLATLLLIPALASAESVTLYFSAEITDTQDDPLNLWESAGVVPGKQFWGSFTYDTTATNTDLSPLGDSYPFTEFTVNGLDGIYTPNVIQNLAGSPGDYWQIIANWDGVVPNGAIGLTASPQGDLGIQNTDPTAPGYVGDGLGHPIFVPDPSFIVFGGMLYIVFSPEIEIGEAFFSVEVSTEPPADIVIASLVSDVMALNISNGLSNSLDSKLDAALKAVDDINENNDVAAINSLRAFINAVEAQRGGKIQEDEACDLIQAADLIVVLLGGASSGSTCLTQQ